MKIITYNKTNKEEVIKEAIDVLKKGGIIIYPTETTYGMGVDATNPEAVERVFSYKEKREGKPLSIAVTGREMASQYVEVNETADNLYKNFLPGPITVVSDGKHVVAPGVESPTGTLGIRVPDYELVLDLVRIFGKPVTATSANASYQRRPYKIDDILETISERQKSLIDLIIDAGELPHNEPSTVVDTTLNAISVLRQGDVVLSDFEERISSSVEETQDIAKEIIGKYKEAIHQKAIILALQGDMGAGKTHFTKGVGEFLGINQIISSPTFVLEKDYPFVYDEKVNTLAHIDTWRMFSKEEIDELRLPERIANKNIIVIEWAEKAYKQIAALKGEAIIIWVKFSIGKDEQRTIIFSDSFIQ